MAIVTILAYAKIRADESHMDCGVVGCGVGLRGRVFTFDICCFH